MLKGLLAPKRFIGLRLEATFLLAQPAILLRRQGLGCTVCYDDLSDHLRSDTAPDAVPDLVVTAIGRL
ncbi:hypothetical protein [Novosphingobium sp. 17-62-19]|uniref:hypothetical protein n=1 Tax=Novosphingobium sp. 17-62-19 TaxID=1970406 RepID=UPI0025EF0A3C|nr:hypothetical protein [Novosphingobium sp. 17-62-19]HQS96364.1 hypothetical protein [Novosphingobium sp.]